MTREHALRSLRRYVRAHQAVRALQLRGRCSIMVRFQKRHWRRLGRGRTWAGALWSAIGGYSKAQDMGLKAE